MNSLGIAPPKEELASARQKVCAHDDAAGAGSDT